MVRLTAELAYDGSEFEGFQTQPSGRTVQDVVEGRLSSLLGRQVCIAAAGRTDAGVHALGQVVHFDYDLDAEPPHVLSRLGRAPTAEDVARVLNRALTGLSQNTWLPPSVRVMGVRLAPSGDFHARTSCTGKRYVYTLQEGVGDPFTCRYRWALGRDVRLDVEAMQRAADLLTGEHDFSAFAKRTDTRPPRKHMRLLKVERVVAGAEPSSAKCTISGFTVGAAPFTLEGEGVVTITAECDRFLQHMMRYISGTLVDVGRGKLDLSAVSALLERRSQPGALPPQKAPARGLCLYRCFYE